MFFLVCFAKFLPPLKNLASQFRNSKLLKENLQSKGMLYECKQPRRLSQSIEALTATGLAAP
jgi:hypothetical protein